jgi:predicted  nucleic acid-binding Zn-ribbon protein
MTTPSPAEKIESDIFSLKTRLGWLQDNARLNSVRDALEDFDTLARGLPGRIQNLRERGYAFEKDLEPRATDFADQWTKLQPSVTTAANQQAALLQNAMRPLEMQMSQLATVKTNVAAARPLLASLEAGMETMEDKVKAAERQIVGMYDSFRSQVGSLDSHVDQLEWLYSQLAEAKFTLLPTESGIMAVKAVWCPDVKENKDDPEGVLYLTDQRLIFEQKEEIATKKILFITTAKEKVQALKWEAPVALIEESKASKQGLLKNEDHLDLRFGEGAPLETIHLHIWQEGNEWVQLLNRAKSKEFDKSRAIAIDQAEVEKVKSAPSQCPSCGANITQVVLRGTDSLKCEYCGYVIRL